MAWRGRFSCSHHTQRGNLHSKHTQQCAPLRLPRASHSFKGTKLKSASNVSFLHRWQGYLMSLLPSCSFIMHRAHFASLIRSSDFQNTSDFSWKQYSGQRRWQVPLQNTSSSKEVLGPLSPAQVLHIMALELPAIHSFSMPGRNSFRLRIVLQ